MRLLPSPCAALALLVSLATAASVSAFVPSQSLVTQNAQITIARHHRQQQQPAIATTLHASTEEDQETSTSSAPSTPAPQFNGKTILPMRVVTPGLQGHRVAAVYAVLNSSYKKKTGGEGWEHCEHVGITRDLAAALRAHVAARGPKSVAHLRALSFSFPQKGVMEDMAAEWRAKAGEAGGNAPSMAWADDGKVADDGEDAVAAAAEKARQEELIRIIEQSAMYDDEDDDDDYDYYDDDDEDSTSSAASLFVDKTDQAGTDTDSVTSPFESDGSKVNANGDDKPLEFNMENVDRVLDEIRPYLISDGGNCRIDRIDEEKQNVYLVLEGACGSCASSTVTMQMGIQRVLNENFPNFGEVIQVEDPDLVDAKPTELTLEAVQSELNRIKPAILAMGGSVEIVSVDTELGVVRLNFRGSNKVKQGLELAIRDVEYVKHVEFESQ